jgi:hypothetical protein
MTKQVPSFKNVKLTKDQQQIIDFLLEDSEYNLLVKQTISGGQTRWATFVLNFSQDDATNKGGVRGNDAKHLIDSGLVFKDDGLVNDLDGNVSQKLGEGSEVYRLNVDFEASIDAQEKAIVETEADAQDDQILFLPLIFSKPIDLDVVEKTLKAHSIVYEREENSICVPDTLLDRAYEVLKTPVAEQKETSEVHPTDLAEAKNAHPDVPEDVLEEEMEQNLAATEPKKPAATKKTKKNPAKKPAAKAVDGFKVEFTINTKHLPKGLTKRDAQQIMNNREVPFAWEKTVIGFPNKKAAQVASEALGFDMANLEGVEPAPKQAKVMIPTKPEIRELPTYRELNADFPYGVVRLFTDRGEEPVLCETGPYYGRKFKTEEEAVQMWEEAMGKGKNVYVVVHVDPANPKNQKKQGRKPGQPIQSIFDLLKEHFGDGEKDAKAIIEKGIELAVLRVKKSLRQYHKVNFLEKTELEIDVEMPVCGSELRFQGSEATCSVTFKDGESVPSTVHLGVTCLFGANYELCRIAGSFGRKETGENVVKVIQQYREAMIGMIGTDWTKTKMTATEKKAASRKRSRKTAKKTS